MLLGRSRVRLARDTTPYLLSPSRNVGYGAETSVGLLVLSGTKNHIIFSSVRNCEPIISLVLSTPHVPLIVCLIVHTIRPRLIIFLLPLLFFLPSLSLHASKFFACRPARKYSTFVFVMEGLVLILTCLLICYNPRDSTEDILIKTGTLVKRRGQPEGGGGAGGEGGGVGGGSTPFDVGGEACLPALEAKQGQSLSVVDTRNAV